MWSWDHLTSKALLREHPDQVYVWNDTQRREAVELHGVPPDRVVVAGAQCFDHWFERHPSRTREELCGQLGFDPAHPIVLYVGSALIKGSPPEIDFVREWLQWLRGGTDAAVASANVLLRPHPRQGAAWHDADLGGLGPVAVWGGNPVDEASRADYFDSLFHAAAVVGLNTSAFIEGAIVGREVLAVLVPRFHDNQDGTAHFQYLLRIGGGLLRVAGDRDTHLAQLREALARPVPADHPHRAFLEAFVRPGGLDQPATPVLVRAVEALAAGRAEAPVRLPSQRRRVLFGRAVQGLSRVLGESLLRSPRERDLDRLARIADAGRRNHV